MWCLMLALDELCVTEKCTSHKRNEAYLVPTLTKKSHMISSDFIWSHVRIIWSSDFSSYFLISQMRILFSHMILYFSHITSDAHLISYKISVSQMNSHVLQYDLRRSDDFLILPVFSDLLSDTFWVYQCDFLLRLSGVELAKVLHFLN